MARQFVIGAKEIEALLKSLPEKVAEKVTTAALRAGAAVIARQARTNIKSNPSIDSGLLLKSVTSRAKKRSKKGSKVVSVGIRRVKEQVKRKGRKGTSAASPSRYAHFVEFGTKNMKAEPFMRTALQQKGAEAIAKITEFMGRGIAREAQKLAKR